MKHIYQVMESGDYDDYMVDLVLEENDEMEIKEKNLQPKGELLRELNF